MSTQVSKPANPKPIRPVMNFTRLAPNDLYTRGVAVLGGIYADPTDFPNPPYDQATFKGQVDTYQISITNALDGGKKAIVVRNHEGVVLIKMLRQLVHYAEAACKDDIPTFL